MLQAVAALLTSGRRDDGEIETPNILIAAQRAVHAVLLGKTTRPDWLSHGFPGSALCDSFPVTLKQRAGSDDGGHFTKTDRAASSLAFDGRYLYLLQNGIIYKLGSGYGGTVKGQLIAQRKVAAAGHRPHHGWLGWIKSHLYYQPNNWTKNELVKLDPETLREIARVTLGVAQWGASVSATDGDYLILMTASKDSDTFSLRTLKPSTSAPAASNVVQNEPEAAGTSTPTYLMPVVQELTLKLAHKCLAACGGLGQSLFDVPGREQGAVAAEAPEPNIDQHRYGFKNIVR